MSNEGIKSYIKECFDKQTKELKDFVCLEFPEEFRNNPYFFKGKQVKVAPSASYSSGIKVDKCFQKDGNIYPHLFHTFDPQLNNITDMIRELLENVGTNQHKQIIKDLEKSRDLLLDLINHKNSFEGEESGKNHRLLLEIIDLLHKITDKQESQRCVTLADLEKLKNNSKQKELQIREPTINPFAPLWRI